ncbi:RICIN domain-containing protein [Massilia sp. CCM 9210]|uniref:RICIN domain-containing protein n=1 Tax=Massilia scottii TaxID=3057166 RepID=UPI002796AA52|nr:RICIN domain-containing protein [Massilia sp. CCM 9210]MDQ1816423.1 RICIN domain-containing protein [Massilia sp. CCM 9210]
MTEFPVSDASIRPFPARRLAALAASLAIPLALMANPASAANCSAAVTNGGLYSVVNAASGKALDIVAGSTQGGAEVQQWGYGGSANQQFYLRDAGNGYWTMQAKQSGLLLDVLNLSANDGARIIQWNATGAHNQQWLLKKSASGGYNVVARHSGKSLTAGDNNSGSRVYQAIDSAGGLQRWFFNPTNGSCGGPAPDGFAAQRGADGLSTTTGGGNTAPVTVTSCSALSGALQSAAAAVIQIPAGTTIDCRTPVRSQSTCAVACPTYQDPGKSTYRIPVGAQTCKELGSTSETRYMRPRDEINIRVGSNKTLVGLNKDARIIGASLTLSGARNVIIRNLSIENINPGMVEAGDGITVSKSSHVWVDHVRFSMISDGHIDIQDSKNVTLSWNRFDGTNPAVCGNQHHYTNAFSNSQVTLHHNFWNKTSGRNPKLMGAASRTHLYNNYWLDVPYFAISADDFAQVKVEGNFFANTARPHWNGSNGLIDANIASNRYTGKSATDADRDTGAKVFSDTVLFPYKLDNVDNLPAALTGGTGAR